MMLIMEDSRTSTEQATFELLFERTGDRYTHTLCVCVDDHKSPAIVSFEGDDQTLWPPSPPIQDVTFEERNDCSVFLGVGRAGTAHWSSSFQLMDNKRRLVIEHACRTPVVPEVLSISYSIKDHWLIDAPDKKGLVVLESLQAKQQLRIEAANIEKSDRIVSAYANISEHCKFPATLQWGMVVELV